MLANEKWSCKYDELASFYPKFYTTVFEMDAILRAEGELADGVDNGIKLMLQNNFIDSADDGTLTQLEKFLGLSQGSSKTLDERRRLVKTYFTGQGKVSVSAIAEAIYQISGLECEIEFSHWDDDGNEGLFITQTSRYANAYEADILNYLAQRLPAHIAYKYTYNRTCNSWADVKEKVGTWATMSGITWDEVQYYGSES